ncbi:MAG: hypothetical protein DI562_01965 [Stenotrophomonas acidaminiphila]|nr:MAG: hypothetical protein DI562_01965 [Stenotrophomonas acidaminiphila]
MFWMTDGLFQMELLAEHGPYDAASRLCPPSLPFLQGSPPDVGYIAASLERIAWMAAYRTLDCISTCSLSERLAYRVLSQGSYRHHCEQLHHRLDQIRPDVITRLRTMGLTLDHVPEAGMYVWAKLPEGMDAMALARKMIGQGHLLAPGQAFCGEDKFRSHVRFNLAESAEASAFSALEVQLSRNLAR